MEAQDNKIIEIPSGDGKEDFKIRKQIIWQFYQDWKKKNPSLKRFNLSLKDFINIRFVSIDETSHQAAKSYLSTLAVLQLDSILTMAKKYRTVKAKIKDKNQKQFNKLLWMKYNLPGVGEVKLMVGIVRRTKDKVQYCITVIQA
ncbi:MAG: hypothetical protein IKH44_02075 [Bacteroidales bacterium]|nr:hypothetical protein [Bacteroidales bacterium]